MDISPSGGGYPWNNDIEPAEYPCDGTEDIQDIICRIEEDFPEDLTNGPPRYVSVPYNNPLFQLLSSVPGPQLPVPHAPAAAHTPAPHFPMPPFPAPQPAAASSSRALHSPVPPPHIPAPHHVASGSGALHSPAPPHQAHAFSSPGPPTPGPSTLYPSAPGPSTLGPPTLSSPTPGPSAPAPVASASISAPAAKAINFVMVMDGERGKRVSKKTGVMKTRHVPKMPQALKDYDPHKPEDDATIVLIVEEAERKMQEQAVRQMKLTDQGDRELKVKAELQAAANKHFPMDAASADAWADRNWVALYNHLSKPLSDIMRKLKSVAETHYIQGYALRPGARSPEALNEKSYAMKRVQELIPPATPEDEFAILAFIFDIHSSYPLEHPVIWNVLLDTVSTLGYNKYIGEAESLDGLFMSTVAAIYSCLVQVPKGKKLTVLASTDILSTLIRLTDPDQPFAVQGEVLLTFLFLVHSAVHRNSTPA
ncbi:hypothetical protein EV702DRAFT_1203159 [Suillus placidus]|uniref:Uncharacterized protein n=1 Tax=Suillus placidus TaxID=48579 RepID=A0A9P6ZJF9_9AGAM|nr:hypothetical protein EV702DRAFT_1203159 [Suillus placidus]